MWPRSSVVRFGLLISGFVLTLAAVWYKVQLLRPGPEVSVQATDVKDLIVQNAEGLDDDYSRGADGRNEIVVAGKELSQDIGLENTNAISTASVIGDTNSRMESALNALGLLGISLVSFDPSRPPSIILTSDQPNGAITSTGSTLTSQSLISSINSPCLWGDASGRVSCLTQYARTRACQMDSLMFPSLRMDLEHECFRALTLFLNNDAPPSEGRDTLYYFFPSRSGDGGDGLPLTSLTSIEKRYPALRKGSSNKTIVDDEQVEMFCKRSRLARDVIQLRDTDNRDAITVTVMIATRNPLVALASIPERKGTQVEESVQRSVFDIARFVVRAIQHSRTAVRRMLNDGFSEFQVFSLRLGMNRKGHTKLISIKSSPKIDVEMWSSLLSRIADSKIWGTFPQHKSFESPHRISTIIDERIKSDQEESDACGNPKETNTFTTMMVKRPMPTCARGEVAFGSALSCSHLLFHPNTASLTITPLKSSRKLFRYKEKDQICGASEMISIESLIRAQAAGIKLLPRKCSGYVSFQQAKQFCEAAGARLCSLQELTSAQLTADTGCEGDVKRVWTLTRCSHSPPSYLTAPGEATKGSDPKGKEAFPVRCLRAEHKGTSFQPLAMSRCCADEAPPRCVKHNDPKLWITRAVNNEAKLERCPRPDAIRGSELTCAELRFRYLEEHGMTNDAGNRVCARVIEPDRVPDYLDTATCKGEQKTYAEARNTCVSMGARLCTAKELASGGTSNPIPMRACAWKHGIQAWSSDPCLDPGEARLASPFPSTSGVRCIAPTESQRALVVCCGDEYGQYCSTSSHL